MASNYGPAFGFRKSDESVRRTEGRYRTPATGSTLLQGTCVEIDPSNAGFLRVGAANVKARTGICGLLTQEEAEFRTIYESLVIDTYALSATYKNTLSVVTNGAGTKIWLKNTAAITQVDGRPQIPAITMFVTTSVAKGVQLGWDGTHWAYVDGSTITNGHMEVVEYDSANQYLEATLLV